MGLCVFLAKLIGIYMLVMAFELLLHKREFAGGVKDFVASKSLLIFSGSVSVLAGLAIILGHPIYRWNWQGIITLVGYLLLVSGIIRCTFPSLLQKKIPHLVRQGYWVIVLILLLLGGYLTYSGFTAHILN